MKIVPEDSTYQWSKLINKTLVEMDKISKKGAGIFPDWCDTSTDNVVKPVGPKASDRYFMLDDGTISTAPMMSFNSYYDAVRVPWRLAVDYSWNGNYTYRDTSDPNKVVEYNSLDLLKKLNTFVKGTVGGINNIVDGYAVDGSAWKWADRDGFNSGIGGKNKSPVFTSMYSTVSMYDTADTPFAKQCFEITRDNKEKNTPETGFCYYGDCTRLLSLLYLSGKFVDYSDPASYSKPSLYIKNSGDTYTVDGESSYSLTFTAENTKGYIQLTQSDGISLEGVKISIDGGVSFVAIVPNVWCYTTDALETNKTYDIKIQTTSSRKLCISYWSGN